MPNMQESRKLYQPSITVFFTIWEGVEDLLNNNKREIDYIIISMEIKEEYKTYFIEFREVNNTQTIIILNDQSVQHTVTSKDIFKALLLQLLKTSVFIFKN